MKEIINALIPAVSGVLGAIVGGWITSRAAIKRIDFDARQLRYQSKMNAYSAFISGYQQFILTSKKEHIKAPDFLSDSEADAGIHFAGIYSAALLHAPRDLRKDLVLLYGAALDVAETGVGSQAARGLYGQVIDKMHKDLENTLIKGSS